MSTHSTTQEPEAAQAGQPKAGKGLAAAAATLYPASSPSSYAEAAFHALHRALQAAQSCDEGLELDTLAAALRRLSSRCHAHALQLTSHPFEPTACPQAAQRLRMDRQRARAVADAAQAVSKFVQGRALGTLDQGALNDSWLRVWDGLAPSSARLAGD